MTFIETKVQHPPTRYQMRKKKDDRESTKEYTQNG